VRRRTPRVNPTEARPLDIAPWGWTARPNEQRASRCSATRTPDRWSPPAGLPAGTESGLQAYRIDRNQRVKNGLLANGFHYKGVEHLNRERTAFYPEMTVDQAFHLHAGARRVFRALPPGGCSNCSISESHTIGAISEDYGIPLRCCSTALTNSSKAQTGGRRQGENSGRDPRKGPQLANVPEIGEIRCRERRIHRRVREVRLQGLARTSSRSKATAPQAKSAALQGPAVANPSSTLCQWVTPARPPSSTGRLPRRLWLKESLSGRDPILYQHPYPRSCGSSARFRSFSSPKRGGGNGERTPARRRRARLDAAQQRSVLQQLIASARRLSSSSSTNGVNFGMRAFARSGEKSFTCAHLRRGPFRRWPEPSNQDL